MGERKWQEKRGTWQEKRTFWDTPTLRSYSVEAPTL
jgi:hypothetical protein